MDQSDVTNLIVESAEKILSDFCDKKLLDQCEAGGFAKELWEEIRTNGFLDLGIFKEQYSNQDVFAFLKICGRYAAPLPLAETILARGWFPDSLGDESGVASIGVVDGLEVKRVAWGRFTEWLVAINIEDMSLRLFKDFEVVEEKMNMAGEPSDTLKVGDPFSAIELKEEPFAQMALAKTNLLAGTLQSVLDLGLLFATDRVQFGRSISKFQAIQHSLAVIAAEVAAAQRAADAAVDSIGGERFVIEVAAGKARVGEAVGIVAEQTHQIHGAMGFTHEHQLHHFTRRLWAWRDEWGSESYWQRRLGEWLSKQGPDKLWASLATPG